MFTLGIQQTALQCLTSRSMLWTGNSALPSVWRVYPHRSELPWWYWGAEPAQGKPRGCWLSKRLTWTCLCSESRQGLWELYCPSLLLLWNWEPPSACPEDTGWIQPWHWRVVGQTDEGRQPFSSCDLRQEPTLPKLKRVFRSLRRDFVTTGLDLAHLLLLKTSSVLRRK